MPRFAPRLKRGAVLADVTSANIVGYNTATVNGGKQIALALQFDDVANPGKAIKVDEVITGVSHKSSSQFTTACDQIWRWDSDPSVNTWVKYGYRAIDKKNSAWNRYDGANWQPLTDDDVVNPGETFIYFNANSTAVTITLAGGVKEFTATPEYTISNGKQRFVCYPWPVAFKLSNITKCYAGGKSSSQFTTACDQIWRWDATPSVNTWVKYGLRAVDKKTNQWQKYVNNAWSGVALDDETDVVPAGQGFIFFNAGASAITLNFKFGEDAE